MCQSQGLGLRKQTNKVFKSENLTGASLDAKARTQRSTTKQELDRVSGGQVASRSKEEQGAKPLKG